MSRIILEDEEWALLGFGAPDTTYAIRHRCSGKPDVVSWRYIWHFKHLLTIKKPCEYCQKPAPDHLQTLFLLLSSESL